MHNYTVALRISGPDLDVAEASAKLGLNPTQTRIIGEARSPTSVWRESMWEYEVRPVGGEVWVSLEDGLRTVISVLDSRKSELRNYQQRCRVYLWCGHFSSSFDGGPTLSPQILKAPAEFGVELILDTYFSRRPEA